MNGYICYYKGKRFEIYADSTFEAQKKCAIDNNIKKRYEISVMLAEKNGVQVTHIPLF
jgi:N-methylhydantoinase B/oxoprolinase/acetone carboxylase alpha subunit